MKILMRFPQGKPKAVTLSFDDGIRQDKKLIKLLDKYGLKCTFNISSGLYSNDDSNADTGEGRMCLEEAKQTYIGTEHEVAIHGLNHPHLEKLTEPQITCEIFNDKNNLENQFGKIIYGGAYPYGTYNDKVIKIMKDSGIKYCRSTKSTNGFNISRNWLTWEATCHLPSGNLFELVDKFNARDVDKTRDEGILFYLWGHSYELERKSANPPVNEWERIEKFAQAIANQDNVWYATNTEIYDYVSAFDSLVFSADSTMVHNPTAIEVYFICNQKLYCIKSNETIKIS